MSQAEFAQEYLADFNTYEGQVWNFNSEICVEDLSAMNWGDCDVFAGLLLIGGRRQTAILPYMIVELGHFALILAAVIAIVPP